MREKLIKLIGYEVVPYFAERIADHLLSNGVTIPVRCKDCAYNEIGSCNFSEAVSAEYDPDHFCSCGAKMDAESKVVEIDQVKKMDGDSQ